MNMKQQDYLYYLVNALSQTEKRFFNLHSQLQKGHKTYLELFNYLQNTQNYSHKKLKQYNKDHQLFTNISVAKNYLYYQLLKNLRHYHDSLSANTKIYNALREIEILYQKGLLEQALTILKKTRKLATKYERFGLLIELNTWERRLSLVFTKAPRSMEAIAIEEQQLVDKQQNIVKYQQLLFDQKRIKKAVGTAEHTVWIEQVNTILKHPLLNNLDLALSTRAKYIFYRTQIGCHSLLVDYKKTYVLSKQLLHSDLQILDEYDYFDLILEHITSCYFSLEEGEALHYLALLDKLKKELTIGQFPQVQLKIFYWQSNYGLYIYSKTGHFKEANEKIIHIEKELQILDNQLTNEMKYVIYYALTFCSFYLDKPEKSLYWCNRLLNIGNPNLRIDMYYRAQLINLFLLFELRYFSTLKHTLRTTSNFFKKRRQQAHEFRLELAIIQYLKRLIVPQGEANYQKLMQAFHDKLVEILTSDDYVLIMNMDWNIYLNWVKSQLEGKKMSEILSRVVGRLKRYDG